MRHFMGECGIVAFAIAERRQLRHLHDVAARAVKAAATAVLNAGPGAGEKTLDTLQPVDVLVERRHEAGRGASPRAISDRNRGRDHLGMWRFHFGITGDLKSE
jgi:hypothetical protein